MRLIAIVLVVLAAWNGAVADHAPLGRCGSNAPSLGILSVGDGTAARTFYVDDRNHVLGQGTWVYEETNGIFTPYEVLGVHDAGPPRVAYWWTWVEATVTADARGPEHNLQRGGRSAIVPDDQDVCVDDPAVPPDALLV